jgi:hypothetical protein
VLVTNGDYGYFDENIISGNGSTGLMICDTASCFGQPPGGSTNSNFLYRNRIGTDALGGFLPNSSDGVYITNSDNNYVGSPYDSTYANEVANNGGFGVRIDGSAVGNLVRSRIYNNFLLGIDLVGGGVTANDVGDADVGANNLQNFPTINSAVGGVSTRVLASVKTTSNASVQVDVYTSPSCDGSGYGEGAVHLGTTSGTTDGSGSLSVSLTAGPTTLGHVVTATATATLPNDGTSEFSACYILGPDGDGDGIDDAADKLSEQAEPRSGERRR